MGPSGMQPGPQNKFRSLRGYCFTFPDTAYAHKAENWLELLEAYEAGKRKAACLNFAAEGYKAAPYAEEISKVVIKQIIGQSR